jgi:hypothetical protein
MAAGTPKYNAYVGGQYEATPLINTNNSAIYLGPTPPSNAKRYLWDMAIRCTTSTQNIPISLVLLDYVLFYPLIDGGSTEQQDLVNTEILPRYTDGAGLRMMLVATAPMTTNGDVTVSYTNHSGISGRTSLGSVSFSPNIGAVVSCTTTSAAASKIGPYLPLAGGDYGIRSVESVTFSGEVGGFMSLVLVKPIAQILIREAATISEVELFRSKGGPPAIPDGAFLNYIFQSSGTGNPGVTNGWLRFLSA